MIPAWLLAEANRDPGLRGRIHPRDMTIERVAIKCDGKVVGFYRPHRAASGRLRLGPIYVTPEYRGRGLVSSVYRAISEPMMASIVDIHEESRRLHERVGFVRVRRFARGWYYYRD